MNLLIATLSSPTEDCRDSFKHWMEVSTEGFNWG